MSETAERVPAVCPSCSPEEPTVHEVLKPGGRATVRCTDCQHVHKTRIETETEIDVDVVVSQGGESLPTAVELSPDETLSVGEEFVVDTPEALLQARITSLQVGEEERAEEATAADVETVWSRAVDNVAVGVTLHPNDGGRDETRSLTVHVPGDYEFVVGETESFGEEEFEIEGVHVRETGDDYRFDKFDRDGDMVFAKDVKRVFARDESSTAWSAW